jgi:hypothetical protein
VAAVLLVAVELTLQWAQRYRFELHRMIAYPAGCQSDPIRLRPSALTSVCC